MLVEICVIIMIIVCFILYNLSTMSPLKLHKYDVSGGPVLTKGNVTFFTFLLSCVHLFADVSVNVCVCRSARNPSQVFKNLLLLGYQRSLSQK